MNSNELIVNTYSHEIGHGKMTVHVNVNGSLVPLEGIRTQVMRDSEGDTTILVLDPKVKVDPDAR